MLLFVVPNLTWGQQQSIQIPRDVRLVLNKRFPGWKFVDVNPDIHKSLKENVSANARPELIRGDFDGNGLLDYAAYIVHGTAPNRKVSIVALLRTRNRPKLYVLESNTIVTEPVSSDSYLALYKKGEEGYNYHTDKKFRYANDVIFVGIFEKAGVSYVYRNGRFRYIVTSD
jgi:hypothetical protein